MLAVTIFVCLILIACNVLYDSNETEEKVEDAESEFKKDK